MGIIEHNQLDELDFRILSLLQRDGRMAYTAMAKALDVSEGTIRNRVRRLEEGNFVQVVGVAEPSRTGFSEVFIWVKAERGKIVHVMEQLSSLPQTRYVAYATGAYDLVAIAVVASRHNLLHFLTEELGKIDGIEETDTSVILETIKQTYDWVPWPQGEPTVTDERAQDPPEVEEFDVDQLDDLDRQLIAYLQKDGRYRFQDMANAVGVTERTIRRRFGILTGSGILRIVGVINPFQVGMNTVAIVGAKVNRQHIDTIAKQLARQKEVRYVAVATGPYDLIIEAVMPSNDELCDFLVDRLTRFTGISRTDTAMVLRVCKQIFNWPID